MNKLLLYQTAHMDYPYTLPPLDYAYDALEPHIDNKRCICIMTSIIRLTPITPTKWSENILSCKKQIW